jgi:hypothetical protein
VNAISHCFEENAKARRREDARRGEGGRWHGLKTRGTNGDFRGTSFQPRTPPKNSPLPASRSFAPSRLRVLCDRRSRAAFALIILLVALVLVSVFALVAARLIGTALRVHGDVGRIQAETRAADAAVSQLRRDVWGARSVTVAGGKSVRIDAGGRESVAWGVDAAGTLWRAERAPGAPPLVPGEGPPASAPRWRDVGARMTFAWDGAALVVRGADNGADRAGGLRLVSAVPGDGGAGATGGGR